MRYYSFKYNYWVDNFSFPEILLGDGNILFNTDGITFGPSGPEVLDSDNLDNHLSVNYNISTFGNTLAMSMYRIEEEETVYIIFLTSVVQDTGAFYPSKIPEGVLIVRNGILRFYRIYTIFELTDSYTGIVFNGSPMYLLKEQPTLDMQLSKFNIDSIESITSMFKFDFSFNGVSKINIHNAIMSIFRNPGESGSLVPPITL